MLKRDYYMILGINREESPLGVREAFRRLAKRYHPDIAGPKWLNHFQEIVNAYEVLSDPERRRYYNEGLEQAGETARSQPVVTGYGREPEPLVPEPVSIMRNFRTASNPFEEIFQRFSRNFTGLSIPKAERPRSLTVEIILSPDEALKGGRLPLNVPAVYPCPFCDGTGEEWPFRCLTCNGSGTIEEEETMVLRIPPGIASGESVEIPLQGLGIHNIYLRIVFRIGTNA